MRIKAVSLQACVLLIVAGHRLVLITKVIQLKVPNCKRLRETDDTCTQIGNDQREHPRLNRSTGCSLHDRQLGSDQVDAALFDWPSGFGMF